MAAPTKARVCEYFNYNPATGDLLFKERPRAEFSPARYVSHLKAIGRPAGNIDSQGYVKVVVDGLGHKAHRVIWLMHYGEWPAHPEFEIDHINGDRSDNRLCNLRKVTKSENQRNSGHRVNNTSGVHGVNWKKRGNSGRWVARIWNGPRHVYLGQFETLHEASIARRAAEKVLGFTGIGRPTFAKSSSEKENA